MALDINRLYQDNLGRAPDAEGFAHWNNMLNSGASPDDVRNAFYTAAAKEIQKDDSGLSADMDAWDEARIVDGMRLYGTNPAMLAANVGSFFKKGGDTISTSASDRLAGLEKRFDPKTGMISQGSVGGIPAPTAASPLSNPFAFSQQNPYLDQMGDAITGQVTDNLQRNILPGIASSAMQAGGFGGSRQGVVEANALNDANQGLSNALTGMRFGDYNNTMGRQLQKYGMDQSYNLGMGNLALGNKNSDQGFYTQQRGQDLQQVGLGASLFGQGNQGMLNQGQGIYNLGLTGQQAPWQAMQNFGNVAQPYTGFGSTSSSGSTEGSKGAGFLGGALAGSQAYNIFSGGGSNNPMGVQNTNGFTNTPNYLRFDL